MPSFMNTPEALLGRNDSKKPNSTCKGITSNGRPCRRALAASPRPSAFVNKRNSALHGVVAIVQEDGEDTEADFYCWQHKAQAQARAANDEHNNGGRGAKRRSTELFPLKEKSSIDTMVQRLGLDALPEEGRKAKKKGRNPRPPKRTDAQDYAARPGMAEPTAHVANGHESAHPVRRPQKKPGFWASLCCIAEQDDDYVEIVRHKKRVSQPQRPDMATSGTPPRTPSRPAEPRRPSSTSVPARKPASPAPATPPARRRESNAQTNQLMSYIPDHLSPQTSALLAELIKPISPYDEDGYIYIFWLTPQSKTAPAESRARSLLVPDRPKHERRISDVMTEYSFDGSDDTQQSRNGKKTIMLKIGRANNVTRRMHEWQRQCGYALNLVRWYPYVSSSASPSPQRQSQQSLYPDLSRPPTGRRQSSQGDAVRKVPCVKRVERLIHLELHEQQVKRQCEACGKEHREWFEVEASQAGVKAVDECVKRWVGWAEKEVGVV